MYPAGERIRKPTPVDYEEQWDYGGVVHGDSTPDAEGNFRHNPSKKFFAENLAGGGDVGQGIRARLGAGEGNSGGGEWDGVDEFYSAI